MDFARLECMMSKTRQKKLYEEIVEHVLRRIRSGELQSGDKLPTEKELAERMRVSKTAVREAMSALESMGYTRSRVGEGTFVADVTLDSLMLPVSIVLSQDRDRVEDLLELRTILEMRSAELAAQRISPEQKDKLRGMLEDMGRAVSAGGTGCTQDADFHMLLAHSTGNRVFCRIFEMCQNILMETIALVMNHPGQGRLAYEKHRQIYDAVCAGDSRAAAEAMRQHLEANAGTLAKIRDSKNSEGERPQ